MRRTEIPILMYHEIASPPSEKGRKLHVKPDELAGQLDWLKENGYRTVSLAEVHGCFRGGRRLPQRPIALTFDDGNRSAYETVLPMLKRRDMKATFFLYPGRFGHSNGLTTEMVRSLAAAGMEIGSHTMSHPDLTRLCRDKLQWELAQSKAVLEALLGKGVEFLCYPYGRLNGKVIAQAKLCGYRGGVICRFGKARIRQDPYRQDQTRPLPMEENEDHRR